MNTVRRMKIVVALASCAALVGVVSGAGSASASASSDVVASYNGGTIDLTQGWGSATVCALTSHGTDCFTNQGQYQQWASAQSQSSSMSAPLATSCSTGLELFQNIGYGGNELILTTPSIWINLSDYSFADVVSSYKVGGCAATMTDGTNGSGAIYPGATSPGSDVSWIGTAWNDRLQSVYLS